MKWNGISTYSRYTIKMYLSIVKFIIVGTVFAGVERSASYNYSLVDNLPLFEEGDTGHYWAPGYLPLLNRKIFQGMRVSVREHPYIASVRRMVSHVCVASILTKNVLITVAHPVIDVPVDELRVVVGENYADRGASLINVVLMVVHENFNPYTMEADLALLRVYPDLLIRVSVKPIPSFRTGYSLDGLTAFVSGWGRCDLTGRELCLSRSSVYTPGENLDPMLRTVKFPLNTISNHCRVYEANNAKLPPGTICLGTARETDPLAPCLAAPGAALVAAGHLLGLQSFGYGCGYEFDLPLIYTDMRHYFPWLVNNKAILSRLKQDKFTTLFNVTRAYILLKWIQMARSQKLSPMTYVWKRIKVWHIDKKLAMLNGTVIDIRDHLYNGNYKMAKHTMYRKLRKKIEDKRRIQEIRNNITVGSNISHIFMTYTPFSKTYATTIEDKINLNQPYYDGSLTYDEEVHYMSD